jgi:hypothetical protein
MSQDGEAESVACCWCKAPFEIVATSTAGAFKCPVCGEPNTLGSLRSPDTKFQGLAYSEHTSKAATANLYRHTAAYRFVKRDGSEEFASGTLVQIGSRYLLATVAHAIPQNLASIVLVKRAELLAIGKVACVTRRSVSEEHDIDVAVFELEGGDLRQLGLEPITLDRIHDAGSGNPNFVTRLCGYPVKWIMPKSSPLPNVSITGFHCLSYGCEPIEPARWHAISTRPRTFDEAVHVVVEFNRDVIDYDTSLEVPSGLPDPFGMSGGGLWQRVRAVADDEIWTPDGYCLFGIQSAWLDETNFLKAIQVIHWLNLVADTYSDLRGELEERFPRLKHIRN